MRNRIGIPEGDDAASAWWVWPRHLGTLSPESQIEFAAFLMTSVLTMAADWDALENESAAAIEAIEHALKILDEAGW